MTGVSGCRATGSRDYATARPRSSCDGACPPRRLRRCEAAPELVELVDRFERLAFHDHWWKQSSRCLPLHQFDGFVSELAPSGGRALSQAAPASSVHRQCVFSRKRPFAFGAAVWEVKGLNLHFRRSRVTITQSSQQP